MNEAAPEGLSFTLTNRGVPLPYEPVGIWLVEPDMDLHWFLTTSPVNFSRHKDTVMDELYQKQSRALDPEERRKFGTASSRISPRCAAG